MYKVIILDDMTYARYRVKQLLCSENIEVYEAATSFDFFNKLYDNKSEINLIILEVGLNSEDGFEVLRKVNKRNLKIPIMILTKMNTRTDFIRCVKEGTDEYVLKPFENKVFLKRINKLIKPHREIQKVKKTKQVIYLNFQEYVVEQISKAKEKGTKVSIMMVSLIKSNSTLEGEKIEAKEKYLVLIDLLYEKLKYLFKAPDLFEKYGFSNCVGVLSWKDNDPINKIDENIQKEYKKVKNKDVRYKGYEIECTSVTYPEDGGEKEELLDKLTIKMKEKINNNVK